MARKTHGTPEKAKKITLGTANLKISAIKKTAGMAHLKENTAAATRVLATLYQGNDLSRAETSLHSNMAQIVDRHTNYDNHSSLCNANRLELFMTLPLVGKVVSDNGIKEAFTSAADSRAHFSDDSQRYY